MGVGWGMMLRCGKISCVAGLLLALVAGGGSAAGQDKPEVPTPKTPSASQSQAASKQNPSAAPGLTAPQDENPKRILGIIPNFETKNDAPAGYEPMSVKEKAAEADQATSSFFIFGFLPHVLHDDPRYFRQGKGSVWYRIHYAATRTVITRRDSGDPTFNTPQVLGQLLQQSISTAYYPQQDRSAGAVFQNWGVNLAYTSAYNVLKEFYPDFLRIVFHKHRERADGAPAN